MDAMTRDILARLRWRQWIAKGTLLGLLAATSAGTWLIAMRADPWQRKWPTLIGPAHGAYVGLGVLTAITLLLTLGKFRHAVPVLIAVGAIVLVFEWVVLGTGLHLLRVPLATALAVWASRVITRS